jgi:hypothetical protein
MLQPRQYRPAAEATCGITTTPRRLGDVPGFEPCIGELTMADSDDRHDTARAQGLDRDRQRWEDPDFEMLEPDSIEAPPIGSNVIID